MAARWLRAQTEKQRIIWGYFLDVLFPTALKKVIYVDSDQIGQADVASCGISTSAARRWR